MECSNNESAIESICDTLLAQLPLLSSLGDEAKAHLRGLLHNQFNALDLVSRQDFDALKEQLRYAQQRLDLLEQEVARLESGYSS